MLRSVFARNLTDADWQLFNAIHTILEALPQEIETDAFVLGIRLPRNQAVSHGVPNCHEMVRGLAPFLPVEIHDGYVAQSRDGKEVKYEHSWLTRIDGNPQIVFDPWPLGVVSGPAVFYQNQHSLHFQECEAVVKDTELLRCNIASLQQAIQAVVTNLGIKLPTTAVAA
jgi:hypothetical protein